MKAVTLKGERIILRPLRLSDAKALLPFVNDKALMKYHFSPKTPFSLKREREFVKQAIKDWKKGTNLDWAITFDGKLIGGISLHHIDKNNLSAELGIWVAHEYQNKGIGYESSKLMINFAFQKLRMNRICYYLYTPNIVSKKLIEKLGGTFEGMQRETTKKDGRFYDSYTYSILKREWKI
jgi:RimJ/RimL family protein N-acetyltransferase